MTPEMSFEVDADRALMRITLSGFFAPSDVDRFVAERNAAFRQLRSAPNQHLTLVDIRTMAIQSQDSVEAFQRVLSDPRTVSRRLAFVVAKSLARLQIHRAAADREAGYFTTVAEAEAWLLS